MKILLATILLLTASISSAGTHCNSLIIGGFSYHAPPLSNYNNVHPAIGVECGDYDVAIMRNSHNRASIGFAKRDILHREGKLEFGYKIGFATGYVREYMGSTKDKDRVEHRYISQPAGGIFPIVQAIGIYRGKRGIVEVGISVVSTLTFKVPFNNVRRN